MCETNNEIIYDVDSDGNTIEIEEKELLKISSNLQKLLKTRAGNFFDIYKAVLDIQECHPEDYERTKEEYGEYFNEDIKIFCVAKGKDKQLDGYKRIKQTLKLYNSIKF